MVRRAWSRSFSRRRISPSHSEVNFIGLVILRKRRAERDGGLESAAVGRSESGLACISICDDEVETADREAISTSGFDATRDLDSVGIVAVSIAVLTVGLLDAIGGERRRFD